MDKVSREKFFKRVYDEKLDVHPSIISDRFPYTSLWTFPRKAGRPVYGKTVDAVNGGRIVTEYFLAGSEA